MLSCADCNEIGQNLSDDTREFKAVSGEARRNSYLRQLWMERNHEMLVGRQCIHTGFGAHNGAVQIGQEAADAAAEFLDVVFRY